MKNIYFISLLILASAILSSAQFGGDLGLTDSCSNALQKLIGGSDANACFPFKSVAPVVFSGQNASLSDLNKPADDICNLPKCSNDLITKAQTDVKTACQQDLSKSNQYAEIFYYSLVLYSPTRDSICFKNSTGGYCFIESLGAAQQVYQSAPKGQDPVLTFIGAPKEVICTPCNKAISNTYLNFQQSNPGAFAEIKEITTDDINKFKGALSTKCGSSFLDGQIGDTTTPPAQFNSQQGPKSSAASLIANRFGFVGLVLSVIVAL